MKRNPSQPKIQREKKLSRVFETLKVGDFKNTLANFDYTQALKRNWADFNTSVGTAGH